MKRRSQQPGFALLMTLVLVLLAGVALTGLARRSMERAVDAQGAAHELKRRWVITSSRAALLGRAEQILRNAEQPDPESQQRDTETAPRTPVPRLFVSCELAGIDYTLAITDEQAKLNANRLLQGRTRGEAQSRLSRFLNDVGGQTGRAAVDLHPRPRSRQKPAKNEPDVSEGDERAAPQLGGYDQVFDNASPRVLLGSARRPGRAAMVTCWGDGAVNIRRAPPNVVREACRGELPATLVEALLAKRAERPFRRLSAMLSRMEDVSDEELGRVSEHLTSRSRCHGLWIVAHGEQRDWYTLAVRADGGFLKTRTYRFAW